MEPEQPRGIAAPLLRLGAAVPVLPGPGAAAVVFTQAGVWGWISHIFPYHWHQPISPWERHAPDPNTVPIDAVGLGRCPGGGDGGGCVFA